VTISQSATRFVKAYSGTGRSFSVTTRRPRPARPTVEVGYAAAPPSGFQQAIPASARTPPPPPPSSSSSSWSSRINHLPVEIHPSTAGIAASSSVRMCDWPGSQIDLCRHLGARGAANEARYRAVCSGCTHGTTSYIQRTLLACARRVYPTHAATDYDYAVGERQHSLLKSSSSSPIRRQPQAPVSNSYSGNISQIMRTRNNSNACQRLLSVADREVPYGVPSRRLVRF